LDAFLSFLVELNVILAWHGLWTILDNWKAEQNHSHEFTGKVMYPKYYKNSNESCTCAVFGCQALLKISAILNILTPGP
jgi:hypothetical protein